MKGRTERPFNISHSTFLVSLSRGSPPIHHHHLPGDPARVVADEKADCGGHFVGADHAGVSVARRHSRVTCRWNGYAHPTAIRTTSARFMPRGRIGRARGKTPDVRVRPARASRTGLYSSTSRSYPSGGSIGTISGVCIEGNRRAWGSLANSIDDDFE